MARSLSWGIAGKSPGAGVMRVGGGGSASIEGFDFAKQSYADFSASLAATGCTVADLGAGSTAAHIFSLSYGTVGKPVIMLIGGQHGGDEWQNAYILRKFMEYLVTPPPGNATFFGLLRDSFRFVCIPLVNPGTFEAGGYCSIGNVVNLNRNYDCGWTAFDASGDPCAGGKGAAVWSEPETRAVRDALLACDPVGFLDLHNAVGVASLDVGIVTGLDTLFWDGVIAASATIAPTATNGSSGLTIPMAYLWARGQQSAKGPYPLSGVIELGRTLPVTEQSRIGLSLLMQYCLKVRDFIAAGWPEEMTLQPDDNTTVDTQLVSAAGTTDYGKLSTFGAGKAAGSTRRGLLKFDLSPIPPNSVISSAVVTLNCQSETVGDDYAVGLHKALVAWYEGAKAGTGVPDAGVDCSVWNFRNYNGSVAWGAAGGQAGVDYEAAPTASTMITGLGPHDWDVSADVQAWINGAPNTGWFVVHGNEAALSGQKNFSSSGSTTPGNRPKLVVQFSPYVG